MKYPYSKSYTVIGKQISITLIAFPLCDILRLFVTFGDLLVTILEYGHVSVHYYAPTYQIHIEWSINIHLNNTFCDLM